jgi:lipoate-protein ligase B
VNSIAWTDLGRRGYAEAWALQHSLVAAHKAGQGRDQLLLVEHEPVITLGRRAERAHVLADARALSERGVVLHHVERGGDATFHGPGQLVAYPILDLRRYRRDVRWYSGALCEVVVRTLTAFGIQASAREGRETGVWVDAASPDGAPGKIAALGVRIERWITYHGLALNVHTDLGYFDLIVPCGLAGVRTASMATCLGRPVDLAEVRPVLLEAFAAVFGARMEPA